MLSQCRKFPVNVMISSFLLAKQFNPRSYIYIYKNLFYSQSYSFDRVHIVIDYQLNPFLQFSFGSSFSVNSLFILLSERLQNYTVLCTDDSVHHNPNTCSFGIYTPSINFYYSKFVLTAIFFAILIAQRTIYVIKLKNLLLSLILVVPQKL